MRTLKTLPLLISSILASGCMENNMHLIGNPPGDLPELEDTGPPLDTGIDDPPDEIPIEPCTGEVETVDWYVEFPQTAGCRWDTGENLTPVDAFYRGHGVQSQQWDLGAGETICDVRFEFSRNMGGIEFPFRYDDHVAFAMNGRILFASDQTVVEPMPVDAAGFKHFDWLALRDANMTWATNAWSVGNDYELTLPAHDTQGNAVVRLDDRAISTVAADALQDRELVLSLHTFGDNDESDCGHTGMGFWVEIDRDLSGTGQ